MDMLYKRISNYYYCTLYANLLYYILYVYLLHCTVHVYLLYYTLGVYCTYRACTNHSQYLGTISMPCQLPTRWETINYVNYGFFFILVPI